MARPVGRTRGSGPVARRDPALARGPRDPVARGASLVFADSTASSSARRPSPRRRRRWGGVLLAWALRAVAIRRDPCARPALEPAGRGLLPGATGWCARGRTRTCGIAHLRRPARPCSSSRMRAMFPPRCPLPPPGTARPDSATAFASSAREVRCAAPVARREPTQASGGRAERPAKSHVLLLLLQLLDVEVAELHQRGRAHPHAVALRAVVLQADRTLRRHSGSWAPSRTCCRSAAR